jgi:thioredoxin 1
MSGGVIVGSIVLVLVGLVVFMQVSIARRARAMEGKAVPPLPGAMGRRIQLQKSALVYLYSPQCGACRAITPRVRALAAKNPAVFAVDVMSDMDLARALGVMATPSTVELRDGKIAGYHVGAIPSPVMKRFDHPTHVGPPGT